MKADVDNMMSSAIKGASALSEYIADSNRAIFFQLARSQQDLATALPDTRTPKIYPPEDAEDSELSLLDGAFFHPEMSHQIFGEQENIFGYKNLKVEARFSAATLKLWLNVNSDGNVKEVGMGSSTSLEGVEPDSIVPKLVELLAEGQVVKNKDEIEKAVAEDAKFKPMGEKMHEWTVDKDGKSRTYEMYHCESTTPGFTDYHDHIQPFIMFYIDAASFLDSDDDRWKYFLVFEKFQENSLTRYAFAGYMTVYQYYAYPKNLRPRISQVLILPPFQRQGLGSTMVHHACQHYWGNKEVVDITVEDPSDDFVRLRDYVDVKNCLQLETFKDSKKSGFTSEMADEAREKYKICKRQARRVYEIIRLHMTDRNNDKEYKDYRVSVKSRLNAPFLKEDRHWKKLEKVLKPEELKATMTLTNKEQRLETLTAQYADLEDQYLRVIERLS